MSSQLKLKTIENAAETTMGTLIEPRACDVAIVTNSNNSNTSFNILQSTVHNYNIIK